MMYWAGQESFEDFWASLTYKQRQWLSEKAREAHAEKSEYAGQFGVPADEDIIWLDGRGED